MAIRDTILIGTAVATAFSVLFNSLLIFLVLKYTASQMKGYSRLILIHCICDIFNCLTILVIRPLFVSTEQQNFMIFLGFFDRTNDNIIQGMFTLSKWIAITQISAIPIDFFYRYMGICHNRELSTWSIIFLFILVDVIVWLYSSPLDWFAKILIIGPKPEFKNYTAMLKQIPEFSNEVPTYVAIVQTNSIASSISILYLFLMVIFSVFVIVYCSTRIHFKVKNIIQVSNNQNVMEINRQVTKVLIIQALLPIISLIVPLIILILFWLLGIAVPMVGIYTYFSGMYFTSIKPIATILIIHTYRQQVQTWLLRPFKSFESASNIIYFTTHSRREDIGRIN